MDILKKYEEMQERNKKMASEAAANSPGQRLINGVRSMFGSRDAQIEGATEAAQAVPLRQAPVQAAPMVPNTGVPEYDAAEQARAERQMALEEALRQLRGGQ